MPSLKEYRMSKGVKASAVARHIGVSQRTYYNYEAKQDKISIGKANAICEFLGCSLDDVFTKDEIFLGEEVN